MIKDKSNSLSIIKLRSGTVAGRTVTGRVESSVDFNETFSFCAEADLFTTSCSIWYCTVFAFCYFSYKILSFFSFWIFVSPWRTHFQWKIMIKSYLLLNFPWRQDLLKIHDLEGFRSSDLGFRSSLLKTIFVFSKYILQIKPNLPVINKHLGTLGAKIWIFRFRVIGDKALLRSLLKCRKQINVQKKGKLNPNCNFFKLFLKLLLK